MKIGIDAMGGDKAPFEIVKGAYEASLLIDDQIVLYGEEEIIKMELSKHSSSGKPRKEILIAATTEVVANEDKPVNAIKRKKDSSMVRGLMDLKHGELDAFISAGNTGALLAGGLLLVGRIRGFERPALTSVYPTDKGISLLVDAGANAEVKATTLVDFALMGSEYSKKVFGVENPKVGLVNVGSEESKGTPVVQEAYKLLKSTDLNFVGNIEGREIPEGAVDVIVTDGFTGNIILKLSEGLGKTFSKTLKEAIMSSFISKLAGLAIKGSLDSFKKKLDYTEYGGAPLLGIKGCLVKAHGSSNAKAMKNAIIYAKKYAESGIVDFLIKEAASREEA